MSKYSVDNMKKRYFHEAPTLKENVIESVNSWIDNLCINLDYWHLKKSAIREIKSAMQSGRIRTLYSLYEEYYEESIVKFLVWLKDNGYDACIEENHICPNNREVKIRW